jgi:glyoxylate/hydroxypyruvate reductase A
MHRPGPLLVYSIYHSDIARFERLLARALPGISIHCASSPEQAAPYLDDTVILYGWGFPPEMLERMPKLRWLQKMGAGVDDIIEHWPFGPNVLLTRTDGKRIAPRMAEYVLGAILDKSMRFDAARAQQQERHWAFFEVGTIRNLTVGIAGLGEIGSMALASSAGADRSRLPRRLTSCSPATPRWRVSSALATSSSSYCR